MSETPTLNIPAAMWPILSCHDAHAEIRFLVEAFGFTATAVYSRADDPTVVEHAELRWPHGGGVMLGTAGKDDGPFGRRRPGNDAVYVVCPDPDALFTRAVEAGADVVRGLADENYGSRGFTVRDPSGHLWSFGTYAGEPDDERSTPRAIPCGTTGSPRRRIRRRSGESSRSFWTPGRQRSWPTTPSGSARSSSRTG